MSSRPPDAAAKPEWVAAMIRNYLQENEVLRENGAIIVQPPGDQQTVLVFQKGGDHLMIQVNAAEVVIS
jgi:hypothetical protein